MSVETMPSVTVLSRPRGAPMATAMSPTLSFEESPNVTAGSCAPSTLTTARSESGSVPTRVALYTEPLLARTSMDGLAAWPSRVTTWVFVRMWPWSSITTPEPVPDELPAVTPIVTTLGAAFAAAAVTALTLSWLLTMIGALWAVDDVPVAWGASRPALPAATPPPSSPATSIPPTRTPVPQRRPCCGGVPGPGR